MTTAGHAHSPSGTPAEHRRRLLTVFVTALAIEDGEIPPPVVGEVVGLRLGFREARDDGPDARISTVRGRAEPRSAEPLRGGRRWNGTRYDRPPRWVTDLHGDGWQATWSAPRPVVGGVELRGTLVADLMVDADLQPTRGRVLRARVVSEALDTRVPRAPRYVPALQLLRDVDSAPRWFDRGARAYDPDGRTGWRPTVYGEPRSQQTGVLLDLDLDDVPPCPGTGCLAADPGPRIPGTGPASRR